MGFVSRGEELDTIRNPELSKALGAVSEYILTSK